MPRLRVLAGPSLDDLTPIATNSGKPLDIKSDAFEGNLAVYIKGFADASGRVGGSPYFEKRKGVTWSIQMQGRFLHEYSADDILFGNVFERPLKLPWGFSAALKFMHYMDPTLEQDLASKSKPWALSPLITTMPYLEHKRVTSAEQEPAFPPEGLVENDISQLTVPTAHKACDISHNRSSVFRESQCRKDIVFGQEDLFTADFCYDYLHFSPEGIDLRLPGGISIDMMRYWDGQPVRFVCCERTRDVKGGQPWGRVLWCVVIEVVDEVGGEKTEQDID